MKSFAQKSDLLNWMSKPARQDLPSAAAADEYFLTMLRDFISGVALHVQCAEFGFKRSFPLNISILGFIDSSPPSLA